MMFVVEREFEVFADFHQFLIGDPSADWGDLRWSPQAVDEMFVQGDGYVAVGTARNMPVPVTVRLVGALQAVSGGWDRVREGTLRVTSGEVVVMGVTDNGASGGRLAVPSGAYRLRVLYGNLNSLSDDGLSGDDDYVIELAPLPLS
jgi:hypothetical protein